VISHVHADTFATQVVEDFLHQPLGVEIKVSSHVRNLTPSLRTFATRVAVFLARSPRRDSWKRKERAWLPRVEGIGAASDLRSSNEPEVQPAPVSGGRPVTLPKLSDVLAVSRVQVF
jgi:hypothetical protein